MENKPSENSSLSSIKNSLNRSLNCNSSYENPTSNNNDRLLNFSKFSNLSNLPNLTQNNLTQGILNQAILNPNNNINPNTAIASTSCLAINQLLQNISSKNAFNKIKNLQFFDQTPPIFNNNVPDRITSNVSSHPNKNTVQNLSSELQNSIKEFENTKIL